jgi:hypothetical protein
LTKCVADQNQHNIVGAGKLCTGSLRKQAERRVLLPSTREPDPDNAGGGIANNIKNPPLAKPNEEVYFCEPLLLPMGILIKP